MVTQAKPPDLHRRFLRRGLLLIVMALLAVLISAGIAGAEPDTDTGGGTYGFNDACEQVQTSLDGVGIPGLPSLGDVLGNGCKLGNVVTHPGDAVAAVRDKAWDTTFGKAVDALLAGLGEALIMSLTWWTKIPTSTTISRADLFTTMRSYTFELQILALTGSLIACAIRIAMAYRHAAAEQATETFRVLARSIFASAIFSTVLVLGTSASDSFATWVIDESTNHDAKGVAEAMLHTQALTALSPGLVFVLALVGMLGAVAQAVFAVIREALLVVVVGVLPLAAASSGTHIGKGTYDRLVGWSIAFVLYKPAAAIIYMIAFTVAGNGGKELTESTTAAQAPSVDTAHQALVGIVLLCSAALVLPALMRLVAPLTSLGGGVSGATVAAGGLGAATMAFAGASRPTGAAPARGGAVGGGSGSGAGGGGTGGNGGGGRSAPPSPPPPPPSSGGGGRGPVGAGSAGRAGGGAAGSVAGTAKATGPVGAAAAGAVHAVGSVARGVDSVVSTAASGPVARPTGAGRAAVPR